MNYFLPKRLTKYNADSVKEEIKRVIQEHFNNEIPQMKEFNKYSRISYATVLKYFDTWHNALENSGYSIKDDMINDLKKVSAINDDGYFTYSFYERNGGRYKLKTLKCYLNCTKWELLLEKYLSITKVRVIRVVKSQRKRKSSFNEDQLFLELNKVWEQLGRRPTYSEFRKLGIIGTKVYENRFGTWTKAIEVFSIKYGCGNQSNEQCWVTDELLLYELDNIASKIQSQTITFEDYKKYGGVHSKGTFQNHFGGWANAVRKIGKKDGGGKGLITNEEMFDELQRIWEMLGRQPKYREMEEYGNINVSLYKQRFNSWIKAVYAFCLNRDRYEGEKEQTTSENGNVEQEEIINKKDDVLPKKNGNFKLIEMKTGRIPSLRLRFNVLKRDNFKCVKCGRSPSTRVGLILEVDHCHPYSDGGETVLENLQTLCFDCNRGKSNMVD